MTYRELYEKALEKPLNQEPTSVIEELENLVEVMKKRNRQVLSDLSPTR